MGAFTEMGKLFPPLAVGTYIPTPGFISIAAHAAVMFDRDCGLVATTGRAEDPEAQRYARLFAAAPDLLAALEDLADGCPMCAAGEECQDDTCFVARAAIAKARGEGE